jgi:hypothetical protein
MKQLRTLVFSLLSVGALAMPASAATFTLDHYSVDLRDADPGLVVWDSPIVTSPLTFTLAAVGSSLTVPLFTLGTNEGAQNWDDAIPYPIDVSFHFTAPSGATGEVEGVTGSLFLGYVSWDNPLALSFGSNGVLSVSLSPGLFTLPGSTTVSATFKLLQAGTTAGAVSVPEPATAILLLTGLLAFSRRSLRLAQ